MKKRRGVTFFVRHFPVCVPSLSLASPLIRQLQIFVERMEAQLQAADGLPIRDRINSAYERIINSVFGSLQQLAKMDRGDGQAAEDKGQLNYHVIMIGAREPRIPSVNSLTRLQRICAISSTMSLSSTLRLWESISKGLRDSMRKICQLTSN